MTTRVQAKRKAGKIVTSFDIYCGRACFRGGWELKSSIWANPFRVGEWGRKTALKKYEKYLRENSDLMSKIENLRGKRLACFCPLDESCHVDVLIKILEELE